MSLWLWYALLSAFFAALTAILAKVGLKDIDADLATLIRTGVIFCLLWALVLSQHKWSNPLLLPSKTWLFLTLSGLATGASWLCYFRALKLGDVTKVAPIDKLSIVLVTLLAVIFLGERPSLRDWAGISLIASGVLLLALKR